MSLRKFPRSLRSPDSVGMRVPPVRNQLIKPRKKDLSGRNSMPDLRRVSSKFLPQVIISRLEEKGPRDWRTPCRVGTDSPALHKESLAGIGHLKTLSGREERFTAALSFPSSNLAN